MHRLKVSSLFFSFLFFSILTPSIGHSWTAQVVSVTDGDSLFVLHHGQKVEIRLYGIDAPEDGQDFDSQAKALTTALVAGRTVDVEEKATDRYGRTVVLVKVDGQSLNELIIQNGYAWVYRHYCKERFCSDWINSEEMAKKQRRGMWAGSTVTPPWEWRAKMREQRHEGSHPEPMPSDIATSEKQQAPPKESWFSKIGNAFTSSNSSGGNNTAKKSQFKCDGRTHCSQMTSCEEATFFLENCPGVKMDGDGDRVPCEKQWCR